MPELCSDDTVVAALPLRMIPFSDVCNVQEELLIMLDFDRRNTCECLCSRVRYMFRVKSVCEVCSLFNRFMLCVKEKQLSRCHLYFLFSFPGAFDAVLQHYFFWQLSQ